MFGSSWLEKLFGQTPQQQTQTSGVNILSLGSPQASAAAAPILGGQASYSPKAGFTAPRTSAPQAPATSGTAPSAGPAPSTNNGPSEIDLARQAFANARGDIEARSGQLEGDYNLVKGDLNQAQTEAEQAAEAQKGELKTQFGDILKNQLRGWQDAGRGRVGMFSSLNSVDSSEFREQDFRANQKLIEDRTRTDTEHAKMDNEVTNRVENFRKAITSELAKAGQQYQQGRQALMSALNDNNLNEAGAIMEQINAAKARAQELQDMVRNFGVQAATLKQQGVDVTGAIKGIVGDEYAGEVTKNLNSANEYGSSLMKKLTEANMNKAAQGFIGKSGKKYQDYQTALAAGDA